MTEQEWLSSDDPVAMLAWLNGDWAGGAHVPYSDRKLRLFACAVARLDGHDVESISHVEACVEAGQPNHNFSDSDAMGRGEFWSLTTSVRAAQEAARFYSTPTASALLRDIVGNPFRPVTLPRGPKCCKCDGRGELRHCDAAGDMDDEPCPACGGSLAGGYKRGTGHRPCLWLTRDVIDLATAAYEERGRKCEACRGDGGVVRSSLMGDYRDGCIICLGTGKIDDGTLDPVRLAVLADALEEAGASGERCGNCKGSGRVKACTMFMYSCYEFSDVCSCADAKEETCVKCSGECTLPHPILAHLRSPGPHYRGCWAVDLILGKE